MEKSIQRFHHRAIKKFRLIMLRRTMISLCNVQQATVGSKSGGLACADRVVSSFPHDELADLVSESSEKEPNPTVPSSWKSNEFHRDSVLFPNELLDTLRGSPLPVRTADRLAQLWSTSNSHGVSWDELDDAFLSFHREYLQAENQWVENYDRLWDQEHKKSEGVLRTTLSGTDAEVALTMNRRRGKVRRMTYTRLARLRNRQIIQPFSLCRFTEYMKEYVSQRVAKREQSEKTLE